MIRPSLKAFLDSLPRFAGEGAAALKPGFGRIEALLAAMDHPHEHYRCVHVAGTNGKGSTASMVAANLTAAGHRVGLHTSPHLFHVRERMRIGGVAAPEPWIYKAVMRYRDVIGDVGASFFETTLALSLLYFADEGAEWAVVEAGLGGRLDATNVLQPELSILTRIGWDHADVLGATLQEIAGEKAGIIKSGVPVLSGEQDDEVLALLRATARARSAPWHAIAQEVVVHHVEEAADGSTFEATTLHRSYDGLQVGLPGAVQVENARTALRAAEMLGVPEAALRTGLQEVKTLSGLRGRFEIFRQAPYVVADVAHNDESLRATLEHIGRLQDGSLKSGSARGRNSRLLVLFGLLRDRDPSVLGRTLRAHAAEVWVTELPSERAWRPGQLTDALRRAGVDVLGAGLPAAGYHELRQQLQPADALLVTGSFQLLEALPDLFHAGDDKEANKHGTPE